MFDFRNMLTVTKKVKDSLRSYYDIDVQIKEYGILVCNNIPYFNIMEAELNGDIPGIAEKYTALTVTDRDKSYIRSALNEAHRVFLIQDDVQRLVNTGKMKEVVQDSYIIIDPVSVYSAGRTINMNKGGKLIVSRNINGDICGFLYKENNQKAIQVSPLMSIIVPFNYKGRKNPVLRYRSTPFSYIKNVAKNGISTSHVNWLKSRIALGENIKISLNIRDLASFLKMLKDADLLRFYNRIIVNKKKLLEFICDHTENIPINIRYAASEAIGKVVMEHADDTAMSRLKLIDETMRPERPLIFGSSRKDVVLSRIITSIQREHKCKTTSELLNIVKVTPFYNTVYNSGGESAFIRRVEPMAGMLIKMIDSLDDNEFIVGDGFSLNDEDSVTLLGYDKSITFSLQKKNIIEIDDFRDRRSLFQMDIANIEKLVSLRKRSRSSSNAKKAMLSNFAAVADRDNALKLYWLFKGMLASFISGANFSVDIKKSLSSKVNRKIVDMLNGPYLNSTIRIVNNNIDSSCIYSEQRMISVGKSHSRHSSSIRIMSNSGIELLDNINNKIKDRDTILTGRTLSDTDSVGFIYRTFSDISLKFKTMKSIRDEINSIGVIEFGKKYLD